MWQTVTTVAAIAVAVAYMRKYTTRIGEAIMATQAENQAQADDLAALIGKVKTELLAEFGRLETQVAEGQTIDFSAARGLLGDLDARNEDVAVGGDTEGAAGDVAVAGGEGAADVPAGEVPAVPVAEDETTV
ncbi:hypothetical protein HQO42_15150 [Rhodococcus fascians]|nr:hypothetical protein [Rhodococcus fascians]MBY4237792.1 hypothetical protein [Rhodococcus fascians]MBY4253995.1 hypothetical protein [Rhodococcus fascians]MBY4269134.1 hypothetical protein [Rhodococcus fascians]